MLVAGCSPRRATTAQVHVSGFPDARITSSPGAGPWSGTERCFQADDGEVFNFTILFDDAYNWYCTAQLEANGITKFSVELGRMSYLETKFQQGFHPHPDRIDLSFLVKDKAQGTMKPLHFVYMLPTSSQALGHMAGFTKLGRNEQVLLCVKSVTSDMESITQELVQKLKDP